MLAPALQRLDFTEDPPDLIDPDVRNGRWQLPPHDVLTGWLLVDFLQAVDVGYFDVANANDVAPLLVNLVPPNLAALFPFRCGAGPTDIPRFAGSLLDEELLGQARESGCLHASGSASTLFRAFYPDGGWFTYSEAEGFRYGTEEIGPRWFSSKRQHPIFREVAQCKAAIIRWSKCRRTGVEGRFAQHIERVLDKLVLRRNQLRPRMAELLCARDGGRRLTRLIDAMPATSDIQVL